MPSLPILTPSTPDLGPEQSPPTSACPPLLSETVNLLDSPKSTCSHTEHDLADLEPSWLTPGKLPSPDSCYQDSPYMSLSCLPSPLLAPSPCEPPPVILGCGFDPAEVFKVLVQTRRFDPVELPPVPPTPPPGHTRFVVISDTHNHHNHLKPLPMGDVLIHCGDFSMDGRWDEVDEFVWFMQQQPHKLKILVPGNHDLTCQAEYYERAFHNRDPVPWSEIHAEKYSVDKVRQALSSCCTLLEDESLVVNGIRLYGSSWVPAVGEWAYELERGEPLRQAWSRIPKGTDVLITHGPPLGHGDLCPHGHVGCEDLLYAVEAIEPQYHVFGHIHEGHGATTNGKTLFVNASVMDERYRVWHDPVVFDVPNKVVDAELG